LEYISLILKKDFSVEMLFGEKVFIQTFYIFSFENILKDKDL